MRGKWTVIALVAALGCGGAESKGPRRGEQQGVDPERAAALMKQAEAKQQAEAFGEARELLREAYRFSDAAIRHRIGLAGEALDEAQAEHVAAEVTALTKQQKCSDALAASAATLQATQETAVPGLLRERTDEAQAGCVAAVIEAGELAHARELLTSDEAKKALDEQRYAALAKQLDEAILEALKERAATALEQRNWPEVTAVLHQAVAKGDAGPEHRDELLKTVRAGVAEDVEKIVGEAFGNAKGAAEALARVDALLAAGFWKPRPRKQESESAVDEETARLQALLEHGDQPKEAKADPKDAPQKPMPEKLDALRRELAFWVACDASRCKPVPPAKMWTYGHAALRPTLAPKAEAKQTLKTGRPVWRIAEGGTLSLVTLKDPGALADLKARAHAGVGWVPSSALRAEDTSEWLPPGESLVGTRVWGPLRDGSKELELGKVIGVEGNNVQIQRLSDQNVVTLPRARLHFGLAKKGSKVLAMCGATSMGPGVIEKVVESKHESLGDSRAVVRCLDDQGQPSDKTREDPLGALRTKREWLPPPR